MKISFVCDWGKSPAELLARFKKQTPNNSGRWGNLEATSAKTFSGFDVSLADIVVGLGSCAFSQKYAHKLIQIRREPDLVTKFNPTPNAKCILDYNKGYPMVAVWWVERPFNELLEMTYPLKKKVVSAIATSKWKHRNDFLRAVSDFSGEGDIDFYGHNLRGVVGKKNYKGVLNYNGNCKFRGLHDYSYSVAIENSSQKNYWTEKIADCFLTWTMPIYWGCPNIFEFFPEHSYYNVDITRPEDIKEILKKPIEKKNINALKEARDLVLNKYNIWPTIENALKDNLK